MRLPSVFSITLICLQLIGLQCSAKVTHSRTKVRSDGRQGKFLSLFSVIQFANDICNTTEPVVQGICYTAAECAARGGSPRSSCAAGFGTCCVFDHSCFGVVDERVAYFRNPNFPLSDSTQNYCTYNAKITDSDVCQLRLDFDTFYMSGPSMTTVPYGQCSSDRMAVFSSQNRLGLSEGNLVCGDMTGQHIYVPVDASPGQDQVSLFAMVGYNTNLAGLLAPNANYTWNIKIQQIDCSGNYYLQAPSGCLQYYTDVSGTIESFNFADPSSPYPISLNYAICIKKSAGFCGIALNTFAEGDQFGLNSNAEMAPFQFDDGCDRDLSNNNMFSADFLAVQGGYTILSGVTLTPASKFCGVYETGVVGERFPGALTNFPGPIVIHFHTDDSLRNRGTGEPIEDPVTAARLVADGVEKGFRLSYSLSANCFN